MFIGKNLAIIPVRTGSKRLPKKNLLDFHGRPLFTYSIDCALNSDLFDEVHVSTESDEVFAMCTELGVEPAFKRPNELASDNATLQQVCDYVITEYERRGISFDAFCILWATAPLRTADDVRNSNALLFDDVDAVVGVTNYDLPYFSGHILDDNNFIKPIYPKMLHGDIERPKVVCINSSLCWVSTKAFCEQKTWLPTNLISYFMPRWRSTDIDTKEDLDWAEYLYFKYVVRCDD
jgi:pseudaminic acid cytidylyltransferase